MRKKLCWLSLLLLCTLALHAQDRSSLDPYRPWVRWWWNGDKVDTVELKRELQLLHDAGIGGVEINPIEFPSKRCDSLGIASLVWLSDDWITALEATLREARRLGMGCDLLVGSGWPFGMETIPMKQRAQVMLTYATEIDWSNNTNNEPFVITKQQIFDAVDPKVTEPNADRQFELVDLFVVPDSVYSIYQRNDYYPLGDTIRLYPLEQIATGWHSSPNNKYVLYALVRCTSFASVINGAPGASGPILDHMNGEAVQHFLNNLSLKLVRRLGPLKRWLRACFVDSMELEGANWTTDFADEFLRRRGYDVMPWLPFTMFKTGRLGDVVSYDYGAHQSPDFKRQVQQVRYDFELTKAELLHERFTTVFANWCREEGVLSRGQAYGRGFFPLESSMVYDIPEGESWTTNYLRHRVGEEMGDQDYRRGRAYTMINKYVSSAAHQTGKRIVSAEEMTNTYRLFETTLELLKLGSDMSAISGVTHSVWHGFNYSPPDAGFPGWVQYGSYLNEQNSWWPYFRLLNDYRARMSALLQHAEMQTDIAIVLPTDRMWAEIGVQTEPFPYYPKGSIYEVPQLLWEAIHKNGGNCDFISPWQLSQSQWVGDFLRYGEKHYAALLILNDNALSIIRKQDTLRVPLPVDGHYLEWYAEVQHQQQLPHAVTIEQPDRYLLQNHYRNDKGDHIFLFLNAHLRQAVASTVHFPSELINETVIWTLDCNSGKCRTIQLDDSNGFWLYLPPTESMVVVISDAMGDIDWSRLQQQWHPAYDEGTHQFTIPMQWHVQLHHAIEGWTQDTVMEQLVDLRQTQYAHFSGTITYTAHLHLDSANLDTLQGVQYTPASLDMMDLGEVYDICQLWVNGVDCGVKWYGRRIYDNIDGLFHPGDNTIVIKVTTTLNNYVHTLTDDKVVQHFVLKRNIPTTPAGLVGFNGRITFY